LFTLASALLLPVLLEKAQRRVAHRRQFDCRVPGPRRRDGTAVLSLALSGTWIWPAAGELRATQVLTMAGSE